MGNSPSAKIPASVLAKKSGFNGIATVMGGASPVSSVEYNSVNVGYDSLFVAIKGEKSDGHDYVRSALEHGASTVLVSPDRASDFKVLIDEGKTLLTAADPRRALSALSAAFFGFPSREMTVIGVTGTNGKTSVTYMYEAVLNQFCRSSKQEDSTGVIGTVNYRWKGKVLSAPNTTPESGDLQRILHEMRQDGVKYAVMEVSSHALEQGRADDVDFSGVIFTNLSPEHMDYHKGMEEYFAAKEKLFRICGRGAGTSKGAVVNADDPWGKRLINGAGAYGFPVAGFSASGEAEYSIDSSSISNTLSGISYKMKSPLPGMTVSLSLPGFFHVYNSLAVAASAMQRGIPHEIIREGLASLKSVPGRFDVINSSAGFGVVVDYAHSPDALEKLLDSVSSLGPRRIITVFGCGGNRDRKKRPLMGKIACEKSDYAVITDDNPRNEKSSDIIDEIITGINSGAYEVISDRESAIRKAVSMASEGDVVVIAGKGHEDYQIIGNEKIHFDDRETVRKYLCAAEVN